MKKEQPKKTTTKGKSQPATNDEAVIDYKATVAMFKHKISLLEKELSEKDKKIKELRETIESLTKTTTVTQPPLNRNNGIVQLVPRGTITETDVQN